MTQVPKPEIILYDWDNTLVDTWPVIHAANNSVFRHMGMREWSLDETKANVRESMRDAYPKLFGDRWEEARDVFYTTFETAHLAELTTLPSAKALLTSIHAAGIPQGIISNKQGKYLREEISALGWEGFFHATLGAGDAEHDKPAPDPVHMVLEGLSIEIGPACWFVGDTHVDMKIAHVTGMTPILVGPNGPETPEFRDVPPAVYFSNLAKLHDFLTTEQGFI